MMPRKSHHRAALRRVRPAQEDIGKGGVQPLLRKSEEPHEETKTGGAVTHGSLRTTPKTKTKKKKIQNTSKKLRWGSKPPQNKKRGYWL